MTTQMNVLLIEAVKLPNTKDGNPRWRLVTSCGIWNTRPNSQSGHDVFNLIPHARPPRPVTIWFDDKGVFKIEADDA